MGKCGNVVGVIGKGEWGNGEIWMEKRVKADGEMDRSGSGNG